MAPPSPWKMIAWIVAGAYFLWRTWRLAQRNSVAQKEPRTKVDDRWLLLTAVLLAGAGCMFISWGEDRHIGWLGLWLGFMAIAFVLYGLFHRAGEKT